VGALALGAVAGMTVSPILAYAAIVTSLVNANLPSALITAGVTTAIGYYLHR
jgi:hypothetical protein